jgi:hypothetical protein
MAYSYYVYTGNGSTTQFNIPFDYIRKEHIKVYVNYVDTAYTYVNASTVQLAAAPASPLRVEVRRVTPLANMLVDYTDGSTLVAADLDTSSLQSLYNEQELDDNQKRGIFVDDATGLITAGSQRITNVANPVSAQDATTKTYVDTADALKVNKAGDTMSGALAMGTNKITGLGTPTVGTDATTKTYVDTFIASTANIANSAVTTVKIADINVTTAKIADLNVTTDKLAADAITNAKLADNAVQVENILNASITVAKMDGAAVVTAAEQAAATANDTSFFTTSATDARFFRQDSSETIASGDPWSSSDAFIATTAAIDARVIDLVDDVGGFFPITNETSFPAANPDINDGAGTIVSIKEMVTSRTPSSGTVTIANGQDSNTVTITGCGATVLTAGFGVLIETTAVLNTYSFHRLVPKATEVTTVASISGNVTTVAGISANVTTVAGISGNVTTVATNIADIQTVAADLNEAVSEIDTVATNIANVNAAGANIANINTVAGNNANVNTVASAIANVNTVATNIANVNAAGANIANVNTVAGNNANVNTVAGISANVTTVAGIPGNVTTVASISGNVTTVATNVANITNASNYLNAFLALYLGQAASDPSLDGLGNGVTGGDLYFNNISSQLRVYNGYAWQSLAENASGNTYPPNANFAVVYVASPGSNTINLGDLTISGGVFPDENSPSNRMSLALGAITYNLGAL